MGRRRKSQAPAETPQITAFREAEKRYRPRTRTPTDYSDVLDLRDGAAAGVAAGAVRRAGPGAYELTDRPGLFVLPGVVAPDAQRRLAFCCYGAYHRPPAETNLTWLARRDGAEPPPRTAAPPANLRWATLGRHYNWTERTYACDHAEPMPRHVAELCDDLCAAIGSSMNAEAAIVNYYRPGDTMGGHVDDAETDRSLPLVSVSLGCSAVFLVGGATRDVAPTAVWLRSGLCGKQPVSSIKYADWADVASDGVGRPKFDFHTGSGDACVFVGEAARSYYHGVPRILPDTCPPHLREATAWPDAPGPGDGDSSDAAYAAGRPTDDEALRGLCEFLRGSRLNLNVREVGD